MKTILTLIFVFTVTFVVHSQNLDLVVSTKGDSIVCKIDSITESHIYYKVMSKTGGYQQGLTLDLLQSYSYNTVTEDQYYYRNGIATFKSVDTISYKYLKMKYSKVPYKRMDSDKYSPDVAFLLSLIPGCGHIYAGEPLRGLFFIGGMGGSFGLMYYGASNIELFSDEDDTFAGILLLSGFIGFTTFYIWNMIDAVKVAKVKNLAFRNNDISLKVLPNFEFTSLSHQPTNNFGIRLILTF